MPGISAFGAYIPKRRLQRSAIAEANVWFDAGLRSHARGERSMCNWDEDSVTLAVAAAREFAGDDTLKALTLASTSTPFADRQCAGIVAEALRLDTGVRTMDVGGSQRCATTALLTMIDTVTARHAAGLVVAADHRQARVGSAAEMLCGDAGVALIIDEGSGIAEFLGGATVSGDFIHHFRGDGERFDYEWEERWVRDEGLLKLVPTAVAQLFENTGQQASDVDHLIVATAMRRVPQSVCRALGIDESKLVDTLMDGCGYSGAAHPLLMLAHVLEQADPGQKILLTGFGQGCDALLFQTTTAITAHQSRLTVSRALRGRVEEHNYSKFQTFNGLVEREFGKRAEMDRSPALSAHNRNREMVNAFIGGKCSACGTVQFPKSHYCVNPNCGKLETQDDQPMADLNGTVMTYTADRLTFDLNPPAYYGLVEFEGGGRALVDFTEVDGDHFDVGTPIQMAFRIKHLDAKRGYRTYFWKAAPE